MSGKHRRLHRPGDATLSRFTCAALILLLLTAFPVWFSAPKPNASEGTPDISALRKQEKTPLPVREAVITPEAAPNRTHYLLLIGQDSRDASRRERSDAMILCVFRSNSPKLTMVSFLRDLYVRIPGHPSGRLNTAYALGGMPLLKDTFRENFGIEVDGCIEVDFDRFVRLVDLMDGVYLELRHDEADAITEICGSPLSEGLQQLSGEQALAYTRIRNLDPDSDFSRTLRQRKLLHAILERCKTCSPLKLLKITGNALPLLSTDIRKDQLITVTSDLLPMLDRLQTESLRIPADGTFQEKLVDGMAVLVADELQTREYLQTVLSGA